MIDTRKEGFFDSSLLKLLKYKFSRSYTGTHRQEWIHSMLSSTVKALDAEGPSSRNFQLNTFRRPQSFFSREHCNNGILQKLIPLNGQLRDPGGVEGFNPPLDEKRNFISLRNNANLATTRAKMSKNATKIKNKQYFQHRKRKIVNFAANQ